MYSRLSWVLVTERANVCLQAHPLGSPPPSSQVFLLCARRAHSCWACFSGVSPTTAASSCLCPPSQTPSSLQTIFRCPWPVPVHHFPDGFRVVSTPTRSHSIHFCFYSYSSSRLPFLSLLGNPVLTKLDLCDPSLYFSFRGTRMKGNLAETCWLRYFHSRSSTFAPGSHQFSTSVSDPPASVRTSVRGFSFHNQS